MHQTRKVFSLVLAILALVGYGSTRAAIHNVDIGDFFFSPVTITINAGDTVEWNHVGAFFHTTTSNTAVWNSGTMSNGMTFQFQFTSGGTYPYHCGFHPLSMNGTVIVNEPNVPPSLVLPGPQGVVVPGDTVKFTVSATDPNAGNTVNITFLGLNPTPSATTPTYTGNNPGMFSWVPVCAEAGTYYAVFQATDDSGATDKDSVLITVQCTIHYIKMFNFQFVPASETVGVGEQVCWVHEDTFCKPPCYHTTTGDGGLWSDSMVLGDTFCFIFDSAGTFPYRCIPHEISGMVGTILVCTAIPGDANGDNTYTLADVIATVNYIFKKAGWPACPVNDYTCWLHALSCRGDWNAIDGVNLADVIRAVNYIFKKTGWPSCPDNNYKCWAPPPVDECCLSPWSI